MNQFHRANNKLISFLNPKTQKSTEICQKNKWNLEHKLIKPEDLNAGHTLFGGQLLKWIDEEAAI